MASRMSPIRGLQSVHRQTSDNLLIQLESQKYQQLLYQKDEQIKSLIEINQELKLSYKEQFKSYRTTIQFLEKQLSESERIRAQQFKLLEQKYDLINEEETNKKSQHSQEIRQLIRQIAQLKAALQTEQSKTELKDHEYKSIKQSYQRQLTTNVRQINTLNKLILKLEQQTSKEIKELNNRQELQKSRNSGLVSSRKQSSHYMQKQIRKLNEEILQKTIEIEKINRQSKKQSKKNQENFKAYNRKMETTLNEKENQLKDKEQQFHKVQKILNKEILQYKNKELSLLSHNQSLIDEIQATKQQKLLINEHYKHRGDEIMELKILLDKQREEHIQEINNLLKERKKKSSSNLGSSRSLGSSLKEAPINSESAPDSQNLPQKLSHSLPPVKEESPDKKDYSHQFNRSSMVDEDTEENQLNKVVYHYESIVEQLKTSHMTELALLQHKNDQLFHRLEQKEQQLLEILNRFSPLVKIHTSEKSLEEDRKERIDRHWKADIALLEILLKKYRIQIFP